MLTRPTEREILALARVFRSEDGDVLVGWLGRALNEVMERLVSADVDAFRKLQGRAESIKDFVEALESAPDLVVKLENRAKGR